MSDGQNSGQNTTDTTESSTDGVSRRDVLIRGSAVAIGMGGASAFVYHEATQPTLAVTGASNVVNSASISTDDGQLVDVAIDEGKAGAGIKLNYDGFESDTPTVDFKIEAKLATDVGGDADGDASYETIASGSKTLSGTSGEVTIGWTNVFGSTTYSLISNHSAMELADFESGTDGNTITRTLDIRLTATYTSASITDTDTASGTSDVTNINASMDVGGNTSINLTG